MTNDRRRQDRRGLRSPEVESDYSRQTIKRRGLRTGYTTGSCAAASAKAATLALLSGEAVRNVTIHLPVGRDATFAVNRCEWLAGSEKVMCSVIKDGGDDPDVTHGAEICTTVSLAPEGQKGIRILGGPGVGTVTRPGTGIDIGEPAVTRVPRRMITESINEAAASLGFFTPSSEAISGRPCKSRDRLDIQGKERGFVVELSVPGGEEIAEKTTNARLGVLGGISILGSTGVVQPYSTAAWRASVHLAIDVAAANGLQHLALSTGTQSEAFAKRYLDLPDMAYIEAGIFTGPSLKRCVIRNIPRATHVGMIGKLSKVAMGYFVTHVAGNKVDPVFLTSLAAECGAPQHAQEEMRQATSARHFQELALAHGVMSVFSLLCQRVCEQSRVFLGDNSNATGLIIDCLCFDYEGDLLGMASTSAERIPLVQN